MNGRFDLVGIKRVRWIQSRQAQNEEKQREKRQGEVTIELIGRRKNYDEEKNNSLYIEWKKGKERNSQSIIVSLNWLRD